MQQKRRRKMDCNWYQIIWDRSLCS